MIRQSLFVGIKAILIFALLFFIGAELLQPRHELGQPYFLSPTARTDTSVAVTIVIVVTSGTNMDQYKTAINSVECYAALHRYSISIEFDDKFEECAVHNDPFFRRHCHTHKLMQTQITEDDWVFFIDADIGVINPNRLIEEYLEEGYEIYLFDRFFNWEYAAGSYIVKNNQRSRNWVDEFSKYEFKLPQSFHGTDNGAIHIFMMNYLVPESLDPRTRSRTASLCLSLWNRSRNWDDLYGMEACTRMVVGERARFPEKKVKIYPKGLGWVHDLWMFHSHWSTDDFMMHDIKEKSLDHFPTFDWLQQRCRNSFLNDWYKFGRSGVFPVLKKLDVAKCKARTESWLMEGRLKVDTATRKKVFERKAYSILKMQFQQLGNTALEIDNMRFERPDNMRRSYAWPSLF